ncbi:class I tRNA ligase family protein [Niabella hibiscisoli]|nr:class I tRNA ligase family protein [Niabella hibiscisoli]
MRNRINEARLEVERLLKEFKLSEALKTIYSLIWDDFCSWYLEWQKPEFGGATINSKLQATIGFFEELLQLLHPYMPFITEEIYHQLKEQNDDLSVKQFEEAGTVDEKIIAQGEILKNVISAVRDARVKNNVKNKEAIRLHIQAEVRADYEPLFSILERQVNAEGIAFTDATVEKCINVLVQKDKLYIETQTELDTTAQKEQLEKDIAYLEGFLISVEKSWATSVLYRTPSRK